MSEEYFEIKARDGFYCRLIKQEIKMYQCIGKVDAKDFKWLVERRGFNSEEIKCLEDGLVFVGLLEEKK